MRRSQGNCDWRWTILSKYFCFICLRHKTCSFYINVNRKNDMGWENKTIIYKSKQLLSYLNISASIRVITTTKECMLLIFQTNCVRSTECSYLFATENCGFLWFIGYISPFCWCLCLLQKTLWYWTQETRIIAPWVLQSIYSCLGWLWKIMDWALHQKKDTHWFIVTRFF